MAGERYVFLSVAAAAWLLAGCGGEADGPTASPPTTRVVVIATGHFITDMPDGYTPAHLRALLSKIRPDVIACEAPSNVADPWKLAPYELWNLTRPWAEEQGIPIVPTGWHEPGYPARISQMVQQIKTKGGAEEFRRNEASFQARSSRHGSAIASMNSGAAYGLWREYHAALHRLYGKDTPWEEWNARILENIVAVCGDHPGKTVAVVYGGAHAYYFVDHLLARTDVSLTSVDEYLPLSQAEIAAHTRPIDYLKALRLLNFRPGMVGREALVRLRRNLERAEGFEEFADDCRLFRGKLHSHEGNPAAALVEFRELKDLPRDVLSAFDGKTPLAEAAALGSAMAYAQLGKPKEARGELERLIQDPSASIEVRQAAENLLAQISKD